MNVKRYFAKDMQEAFETIRSELGPDAVILSSHSVRKKGIAGLFSKSMLEVVVAYETKPSDFSSGDTPQLLGNGEFSDQRQVSVRTHRASQPQMHSYSDMEASASIRDAKLEEMDKKILDIQKMLSNVVGTETGESATQNVDAQVYSEEVQRYFDTLIGNDVQVDIARQIAAEAQSVVTAEGIPTKDAMRKIILERLGEVEPVKRKKNKCNIILFVGATGVGKTTTLVKLAAIYAHKDNTKVAIINNDTYRVAAQAQLETYAEILSCPFTTTYSYDDFVEALEKYKNMDMVFIDTTGRSPKDEQHRGEIEKILSLCEADEIFLLVSASNSAIACKEIIERHVFMQKYKLLITKTDETRTGGVIMNTCTFSGMPLSYISTGQSVPDDLVIADPHTIASQLMGE